MNPNESIADARLFDAGGSSDAEAANLPDLDGTGTDYETERLLQCFSPYILDATRDYGPIQYLFEKNGIGFAPLGDIQAVKAPPKQGKTFTLSLLMGIALRGEEYMGIRCMIEKTSVLFIDTEEHPRNTIQVHRRICAIAQINGRTNHDRLNVLCTRGVEADEQVRILKAAIKVLRPQMVVVDGIKDLCEDFNDAKTSSGLITLLLRLSKDYNCAIFNVLHTNPGSDKMRGHLGTELANKASDTILCKKVMDSTGNPIFSIIQDETRNADISKTNYALQVKEVDGTYIPLPIEAEQQTMSQKEKEELRQVMQQALANGNLSGVNLRDKIMEAGVKKSAAYNRITAAKALRIIGFDDVRKVYYYTGTN